MKLKTYFRLLAQDRLHGGLWNWMLNPCLAGASFFYRIGMYFHKGWYEKGFGKRRKFQIPVVSVGNITWGGTGKTPLVEHLGHFFIEQKKTPLILGRGYGNDENKELVEKIPSALFGFGPDRFTEGQKVLKENPAHVIILDDGFQHWALERNLDLITVSAINPFGNGHLIPRGILREPIQSLKRASIVLLTDVNLVPRKDVDELKEKIRVVAPHIAFMEAHHEPLFFYRPQTKERVSLNRMTGARVTCFSGIGTPRSFQMLINLLGLRTIRTFEFCDHHEYADAELLEIKSMKESSGSEEVITTEKDFFRCSKSIAQIVRPLVLKVRLCISSGEDILHERLRKLVGIEPEIKPFVTQPVLQNSQKEIAESVASPSLVDDLDDSGEVDSPEGNG